MVHGTWWCRYHYYLMGWSRMVPFPGRFFCIIRGRTRISHSYCAFHFGAAHRCRRHPFSTAVVCQQSGVGDDNCLHFSCVRQTFL